MSSKRFIRFTAQLMITVIVTGAVIALSDRYGAQPVEQVIGEGLHATVVSNTPQQALSEMIPALRTKATRAKDPVFRYTVSRGDTLARIWTRYGGEADQATELAKELARVQKDCATLQVGDKVELILNRQREPSGLRRRLDDGRLVVVREGEEGFVSKVVTPTVVERERTVTGTVYSSLSKAARSAGLPYEILDELVDLFGTSVDFRRDLQVGDTFTVIYTERVTKGGKLLGLGPIRAASLDVNGDLLVAVRHQGANKEARYYNAEGKPLGDYFLRYPLQFTRISSVFSKSRFHPLLGKNRPHNGVDFAAPSGTPVRSIADGIITDAGYNKSMGNMVRIRHDEKYTTEYFHLSKITAGLAKGSRISRGMIIGAVGSTGLSTAPHLHFGFFEDGKYVDPLSAKLPTAPVGGDTIPKQYLVATIQTLKQRHAAMHMARGETLPARFS